MPGHINNANPIDRFYANLLDQAYAPVRVAYMAVTLTHVPAKSTNHAVRRSEQKLFTFMDFGCLDKP